MPIALYKRLCHTTDIEEKKSLYHHRSRTQAMTSAKDLYYRAAVEQAKEEILEYGTSLTMAVIEQYELGKYRILSGHAQVQAAYEMYETDNLKYESFQCVAKVPSSQQQTKVEGVMSAALIFIKRVDGYRREQEQPAPTPEVKTEHKEEPAPQVLKEAPNVELMTTAESVNTIIHIKSLAKAKPGKPTTAKVGGVKSKEKRIIDMSAAELKALAKKNNIEFSTVNFRKADEKDAFRSKLAKALGRSSEMNYSVK